MYDTLREYLPLQAEVFKPDNLLHDCGWNKFYANSRGYNYVPVYAEDLTTITGYQEQEDDEVFQNDQFEAASDLAVGFNNGISIALAIALLIEEVSLATSLLIAFTALLFQSLLRVLFNWFEYQNTQNKNYNKFIKLSLAIVNAVIAIIGLILLLTAFVLSLTVLMNALPIIVFAVGAIRAIVHSIYAVANLFLLFAYATNPLDQERYRNQAWKRTLQASGALAVTVVAGLILFKQISVSSISLPVTISLAILSVGALLYSTCRESEPLRTWHPLRYIFKGVNEQLATLSDESIKDKISRYQARIDQDQSPAAVETKIEKLFYHGGGIIEEVNIIRDKDFYKAEREPPKNPTLSNEQITAARLFLKGILLDKLAQNNQEQETLTTKSDFRLFRNTDLNNNSYKREFLTCLLRLHENNQLINVIPEKGTTPIIRNSFNEVTNLTELKYFLKTHSDIRLGIFSALHKHSNSEVIWRTVLKYTELFESPQKALILNCEKSAAAAEEESLTLSLTKDEDRKEEKNARNFSPTAVNEYPPSPSSTQAIDSIHPLSEHHKPITFSDNDEKNSMTES